MTQVELAHFDHFPTDSGVSVSDLVDFSTHLDRVGGVNVSFWWSCPSKKAVAGTIDALKAMPRVNSLFFPGGDGGSLDWDVISEVGVHRRL